MSPVCKSAFYFNFFLFSAFLTTLMLGADDDVWIGFNDVNWEMRFLWTDGKGVTYINWAKGHPSLHPDGSSRMYGYFESEASTHTILLTNAIQYL